MLVHLNIPTLCRGIDFRWLLVIVEGVPPEYCAFNEHTPHSVCT